MVPMFDIFSGRFPQKDAIWIDSVEGLAEAYQAMLRAAAEKPVPHFVLSSHSCVAVASIDTTSFLREQESERAEAAAGSLKHDVAITHVESCGFDVNRVCVVKTLGRRRALHEERVLQNLVKRVVLLINE